MIDLKTKAIKSVFWVASGKFVGQTISWLITLFLIRILTPIDYGLMGMAMTYQAIIVILYDLNLGEAILQKKEINQTDIDSAFWFSIFFGIFLYVLTWIFAAYCAHFFSNDRLIKIIRVLSIGIIFLSAMEVPYHLMARNFEFKRRTILELVGSISGMTTSLVLALYGYGVWSLILGQVFYNFILAVLILLFCQFKLTFNFSIKRIVALLRFSLPITGHKLLQYFYQKSDSVIVGKFLGTRLLGYYSVSLDLSRIPIDKIMVIINKVTYPVFAKLQDNEVELRHYMLKLCYFTSVFIFPVLIGMILIADEIFHLILSPKWIPGLFVFRLFCTIGILQSFAGIFLILLKAKGKTKFVFNYSLFSAVLLPTSFIVGVKFGIEGIALSWLTAYPVLFLFLTVKVIKVLKINRYDLIRNIVPALYAVMLMSFAVLFFKIIIFSSKVSFFNMFTYIVVGAFVYVCYFYFFSNRIFQDGKMILNQLKGKTVPSESA